MTPLQFLVRHPLTYRKHRPLPVPHCLFCHEPVLPWDPKPEYPPRAWDTGEVIPCHRECQFSNVAGHSFGACSCTMPNVSYRDRARIAWARSWERAMRSE